jgi:Ca2+-transporting ATPase
MEKFYSKSSDELLKSFNVSKEGLSTEKVEQAISTFGYNELTEKKKKGPLVVFLEQFKDLLVVILIIAGIISMATGNLESIIIFIFNS